MHATRHSSATRDWVTSAIYLPTPNKVALASLNRGIVFYEITPEHVKRVAQIPTAALDHCVPLCLTQMTNPSQCREVLLAGDDAGQVHAFVAENRHWHFSDGRMVTGTGAEVRKWCPSSRTFSKVCSKLECPTASSYSPPAFLELRV
jgi:hypothetical protein